MMLSKTQLLKVNDDRTAAFTLENGLNIHDYSITEQGIIRVYDRIDEAIDHFASIL